MECLGSPVLALSLKKKRPSRLGYKPLIHADQDDEVDEPVKVVVGSEKREFLVDPSVLEEIPFRNLIDMVSRSGRGEIFRDHRRCRLYRKVIFVDVDAILFEHMLWLMRNNDLSALLELNLEEIIDFYGQE